MADAKGSSFLLRYAEKVIVAILVLACGGYAAWTFMNLTPHNMQALQTALSSLQERIRKEPPATNVQFPTADDFLTVWVITAKVEPIPYDPFQPPKEIVLAKRVDIMPGACVDLRDHLKNLVGKEFRVTAKPQPDDATPGVGLLATIESGGVVKLCAVPGESPKQDVNYKGTVQVADTNNNTVIYREIQVTSHPPLAFPPTLLSAEPERRKVTLTWQEDEKTTAPIPGWHIERRTDEEPFQELKPYMRPLEQGQTVDSLPKPQTSTYADDTVEPSTTYTYRVSTLYRLAGKDERTEASNVVTVTTKSDLALSLRQISKEIATFRVSKWVKDKEVSDSYPVRAGERIGYNRNRPFEKVGEVVDFTTPFVLVDIQPVRQLKRITKKVRAVDETGKPVERQVEMTWWEPSFRAIVYNDVKNTQEIINLEAAAP